MSFVRVSVTGSRLYIRFGYKYYHVHEANDDDDYHSVEEEEINNGDFDCYDKCISDENHPVDEQNFKLGYDNDDEKGEEESEIVFHSAWLWCNDPINNIHISSGQRNQSCVYASFWKIQSASIVQDTEVQQYMKLPPPPPIGSLHPLGGICDSNKSVVANGSNHISSDSRTRRMLLHVVWGKRHNNNDSLIHSDKNLATRNGPNTEQELTTMEAYFDLDWLWQNRYDSRRTIRHDQQTRIIERSTKKRSTPTDTNRTNENKRKKKMKMKPAIRILTCDSQLERFQYKDVFLGNHNKDTAKYDDLIRYRILHAVIRDGAVIVENAPSPSSLETTICRNEVQLPVAQIGMALGGGRLSHGNLYGDVFHVVASGIDTTESANNKDEENNASSNPTASNRNGAKNIAYTSKALVPHQDLAYYESIPGLQLLHCVTMNEQTIVGGESILIDVIAAAEHYRSIVPAALFDPLVYYDATFIKQRIGADMVYRRPHIRLQQQLPPLSSKTGTSFDDNADSTKLLQTTAPSSSPVVSVRWSPPFEGPLFIRSGRSMTKNYRTDGSSDDDDDNDDVEKYYAAYTAFNLMVDNSIPRTETGLMRKTTNCDGDNNNNFNNLEVELIKYAHNHTWEYRLRSGEILIFNNQRMLHGRRSFSVCKHNENDTNNGNNNHDTKRIMGRHLMGCYTNMDDTLNEYRLLRRARLTSKNKDGSTFVGKDQQQHQKVPPIPVVGNHSSGTY